MKDENILNRKIHTQALHAGEETKYADSHITPIFSTSTFVFPSVDIGSQRFAGKEPGYIYTRLANPTIEVTERKIAILEGGTLLKQGIQVEGHAFATGMGGISTIFLALTKKDDVILATNPLYGGTTALLNNVLSSFCVTPKFVDTAGEEGPENIKEALSSSSNVSMIFLESPTNPNLIICDIEEISKIGKEQDIPIVVDNTFATPILQRPLELGADVSLHSTTKYLNGHGTTVSGILASRLVGERRDRLIAAKKSLGATQSPFDAFLVNIGMKTLPLRFERHCTNALAVAEFLADHPRVEEVYYPGLTSHPQHELAKRQMHGRYGGMVACEVKGGLNAGKTLMNCVRVFTLAVSLGAVDSLIQHPASMTHSVVPREIRLKGGITDGLVRISVGLEDIDDLLEDLSQALAKIS